MEIGGKDVSNWSLLMMLFGALMFVSMFLSAIDVKVFDNGYAISGLELLTGGFIIGPYEIGTDSMGLMRLIPSVCGIVGILTVAYSVCSIVMDLNNNKVMTVVSLCQTVTLLLMVMFLIGGIGVEIFTGDVRNILFGLRAEVVPMFGTYMGIFATFLCGMSSTYRLRECMNVQQ